MTQPQFRRPNPLLAPLRTLPTKKLSPTSLEGRVKEFLRYADPALRPNSRTVMRQALQSLLRGVGTTLLPSSQSLLGWLRKRASVDRVSPATLRLERVYASKFFGWCVDMGYMTKNPMKPIPSVPVPIKNRPTISEEEFLALKEKSKGTIFLHLIIVAWYTGARLVDICNLRWSSINLETNELEFVPVKTQKSGRVVKLRLVGEVLAVIKLRRRLSESGDQFVFPMAQFYHTRGDGTLQKMFRSIRDAAGLPKTVTFHCFRHTRASRMLNAAEPVDLITAADVLGLSSVNTLRRYSHVSLDRKEQAMNL